MAAAGQFDGDGLAQAEGPAAGVARAPVRKYAAATAAGAVPYALIYSYLGAGLGRAFLGGRAPELALLARPDVALPLAALAAVSFAAGRWSRRGGRRP